MGKKDESDLNRSREAVPLEGERLPRVGEHSHSSVGVGAAGDERTPLCAWRGSKRSPKDGRTFASSVSIILLRGFRRTIAQGWANVRFLSVYSTIERVSVNNRPRLGERSLPQCV
jgi:hypothetical protein